MTLEQLGILFGIATGILSFLGAVHLNGTRSAKIEVKVDTMWDFLMRRALSEGLEKGVLKVNSPVVISDEAKKWMAGMAIELQQFYRKLGRNLTDRELAYEIERRFGDEILKKVCIPNGLYSGACLLIAMEVAKEISKSP